MRNATGPRPDPRRERLLAVDPARGSIGDHHVADLPRFLRAGDLLVLNDAASLPASFSARLKGPGNPGGALELRLAGEGDRAGEWWTVLLGEGSWRTPTEHRSHPPRVTAGDTLCVEDVAARVEEVSPLSPRLLRVRFDRTGEALYRAFYRHGRPIQYSYVGSDLALWDVQTAYGARPWAVEMPSAGRPLTWDLLQTLRKQGIRLARLTHAAGLSSTGDTELDARLPLPERYEIPERSIRAIAETRAAGGRVVAVGTTVVRALEGSARTNRGTPVPGPGRTDLVLGPRHRLRVVDGILTGIHESGTSHHRLLEAFAPAELLERALDLAEDRGFQQHEFGDSMLVLPA